MPALAKWNDLREGAHSTHMLTLAQYASPNCAAIQAAGEQLNIARLHFASLSLTCRAMRSYDLEAMGDEDGADDLLPLAWQSA